MRVSSVSSVMERLPSTGEALGSISNTEKRGMGGTIKKLINRMILKNDKSSATKGDKSA